MPTLATARSFLFAPGSDEHKLRKAAASATDAVIADLEDAVAAAEKDAARELVGHLLATTAKGPGPLTMVRVNGVDTPFFADDLDAVQALQLDGIVLPKATPAAVEALGVEGPPMVAIIETAEGLRLSYEVASHPRVEAVVLGAIDLGLELGLEPRPDGQELLLARSKLVLDCAAARIRGPIDQVWVDVRDSEGLEADARLARSLGFRGKACIHPKQVEVVNAVFAPSVEELERARRVIEAYERAASRGRGVIALDGEMIDLPVVERARHLLAEAKRRVFYAS